MKRFLPFAGLVVLLCAFAFSAWHAFSLKSPARDGRIVIRLAHQLLQTGMREAFEEAATEYSRLHPNVVIEQNAVPKRSWNAWLITQLIGGTAPDITSLAEVTEEMAARHFVMISDEVSAPNPYNAGTPLDGVPWRDTFVDGLSRMYAMSSTSGELVGVNLQLNTIRVFYNLDLLRKITGSASLPADYRELQELGHKIAAYNQEHEVRLIPIASCAPYLPYLNGMLTPSQTQKLARELSPLKTLTLPPMDQARLFASHQLSYVNTPEVHSSLALLRDVSRLLTPGFAALARDDALFSFMQQRAVAICAGSWDYAAFATEGTFEVGVGPVPLPSADDPEYGGHIIGPASEADGIPEAQLGITRYGKHPEIALDFLRYLTSYRTAQMFTRRTLRLSSIDRVPPSSLAPGLIPRLDGELNGFGVGAPSASFANAQTVFNRNQHLLLGPLGDVDAFAKILDEQMPAALKQDMDRQLAGILRIIRRADTHVGLLLSAPPETRTAQSTSRFFEIQHQRQFEHALYSRPLPSPAASR